MNTCTVYMATHRITGQSYIGVSQNWLQRKRHHKHDRGSYVGDIIRSEGVDNFHWKPLYENLGPGEAVIREIACIKEFNTLAPHGLNRSLARCGVFKLVPSKRKPWTPWRYANASNERAISRAEFMYHNAVRHTLPKDEYTTEPRKARNRTRKSLESARHLNSICKGIADEFRDLARQSRPPKQRQRRSP